MLNAESVERVHLAPGATDLRKSIDGLSALVRAVFELDPFSDQWFVFCNKQRDKLKILRWDYNGFWLYLPAPRTRTIQMADTNRPRIMHKPSTIAVVVGRIEH
jgi:transposase